MPPGAASLHAFFHYTTKGAEKETVLALGVVPLDRKTGAKTPPAGQAAFDMEKRLFNSDPSEVEHHAHHGGEEDKKDGVEALGGLDPVGQHQQNGR